jgi:hypothetical protein
LNNELSALADDQLIVLAVGVTSSWPRFCLCAKTVAVATRHTAAMNVVMPMLLVIRGDTRPTQSNRIRLNTSEPARSARSMSTPSQHTRFSTGHPRFAG